MSHLINPITTTDFFYRLCSFLADNAVFLYLGMTLFGLNDIIEHFNYAFVCWAFFACLVSRAVSIIILAGVSECMLYNIILFVQSSCCIRA
jgi:hypothetical protein